MRMKQFDSTTGHVGASAGEDEEKREWKERSGSILYESKDDVKACRKKGKKACSRERDKNRSTADVRNGKYKWK